MQAIVLAGGRGTRLRPYTTVLPKPLVPVGERPICEIIVRQLAACGFDRIVFAVSHLAGLIEAYFGDGRKWGVAISYSLEDTPLGTAGPIGLIEDLDEDFLVMNGDVLTDLDYRALMQDHRAHGAIATITTYRKDVPISLGVLEIAPDGRLAGYTEKPTIHYQVSMGVYILNRRIRGDLPRRQPLDLPDLMRGLIARGERVHCHAFTGQWLDIGRPEDYEEALSRYARDPGHFDPAPRG
jgi:NDP-sugar pyrophosphorylase family protein